jgi:hypothetical protein
MAHTSHMTNHDETRGETQKKLLICNIFNRITFGLTYLKSCWVAQVGLMVAQLFNINWGKTDEVGALG